MRKDESIERTFKGVAKHFREVFSELVQGGHGFLVMMKKKVCLNLWILVLMQLCDLKCHACTRYPAHSDSLFLKHFYWFFGATLMLYIKKKRILFLFLFY